MWLARGNGFDLANLKAYVARLAFYDHAHDYNVLPGELFGGFLIVQVERNRHGAVLQDVPAVALSDFSRVVDEGERLRDGRLLCLGRGLLRDDGAWRLK